MRAKNIIINLIFVLIIGLNAKADLMPVFKNEELIDRADLIIIGEVLENHEQVDNEGFARDYTRLRIDSFIKNTNFNDKEIVIDCFKGFYPKNGDLKLFYKRPVFIQGQNVLLFLANYKEDHYDAIGAYQGKFEIINNKIKNSTIDIDRFVQEIKLYMNKNIKKLRLTPPRNIDEPSESSRSAAKIAHYGISDFGWHLGGHFRSGSESVRYFSTHPRYIMVFHINPTNAEDLDNVAFDYDDIMPALASVCNTWNNVPCASISCTIDSTETDLGWVGDNVSVISFTNFGASTPSALASESYTSNTNESLESDIKFNSWWNWSMGIIYAGDDSTFDFRHIATHEMGHSLNIAHPDTNRITFASYTMDSRGFQTMSDIWRRDLTWADNAGAVHTTTRPGGTLPSSQAWSFMQHSNGYDVDVTSSITVSLGDSLYLDPGTTVRFPNNATLTVYGSLFIGDNVTLTKSGESNWGGIDIKSGGFMSVGSDVVIEYANTGLTIRDSDGDIDCSSTSTIRNCTTGIYVYNCSPWIRKVKLENNTYKGIEISQGSACPNIYYVTIDGSVNRYTDHAIKGIYGSDAILKYSILKNTSDDCIELNGNSGIDIASAQTDVYRYTGGSKKAIDNTVSPSVGIKVNNTYWGTSNPTASDLFTYPDSVSYAPFAASAFNEGAPKIAAYLPIAKNPFHDAHDFEFFGDWQGALYIYNDIIVNSNNLLQKRMAIKSILRVNEEYNLDFDSLRKTIQNELKTAKSWYKASLDFILCDMFIREGMYNEAIAAFIDKAKSYKGTSMEVSMLSQIAYIYGEMLNDKANSKIYADKAANINPGAEILKIAYDAADIEYDPTQYEDKFAGKIESFDIQPETEEEPVSNENQLYVTVTPNPANPTTTITYSIAEPSNVKLVIYSVSGQKIATLADGHMTAGKHATTFDGSELASGVYFYSFESKGFTKTGKMLLVK